jgi:hypothetical protein
MNKVYTYAELIRMTKKRVIRIAEFKNMKDLVKKGFNKKIVGFNPTTNAPLYERVNASKKYIARMIAGDR